MILPCAIDALPGDGDVINDDEEAASSNGVLLRTAPRTEAARSHGPRALSHSLAHSNRTAQLRGGLASSMQHVESKERSASQQHRSQWRDESVLRPSDLASAESIARAGPQRMAALREDDLLDVDEHDQGRQAHLDRLVQLAGSSGGVPDAATLQAARMLLASATYGHATRSVNAGLSSGGDAPMAYDMVSASPFLPATGSGFGIASRPTALTASAQVGLSDPDARLATLRYTGTVLMCNGVEALI